MKIATVKNQMVLVIHTNKNNKLEYRLCEDMDTAKLLFPKDQKQIIQCYDVDVYTKFYVGNYVKVINPNFSTFGKVGKIISIREDDDYNDYIVLFDEPICGDVHYKGVFLKEDLEKTD